MARQKLTAWLRDRARALNPAGWLIFIGLIAVMLAFGIWLMGEPGRAARRASETRVDAAFGQSRAESGQGAAVIDDAAHDTATANEAQSRKNADAIHNAPGADQRLDPGLNRTGRGRVCQRPSYRNTPECVLILGRPQPAGGRPGR